MTVDPESLFKMKMKDTVVTRIGPLLFHFTVKWKKLNDND